ncbi:translation initiation factor IF-2 [Intestinimonas butyriciproducens]|uniref:translation initiation factor IF-2 n=1 Tax=Intestinimonas butyriciproducens TaxID=1297617 RepID=UPI00195D36BE|nr:translation initiation factor IF-2 [Intestinimonas butyriciproducens]MBM6917602.1 translation initiation factor IF-2 [Intestinimonas butyriciproducens]
MMIKYRVSDVAKDFGRPNKEIAEILGDYLQAPKSNAQALKEPELDVIFEYLTQKNQVESLDQVFAPAAEAALKRRQESEKRILEKQQKEQPKAQKAAEPQKQQGKVVIEQQPTSSTKGPRTTRVDTRGNSVDLSKYDERMDQLVPERAQKINNTPQGKQKIKRQADRRGFVSNKKRQEEQERLRRLQMQEKAKKVQLKVLIPDEINVGELAVRLKKTAADVIKQLMKLGVMANVSQSVDFDTASLVAEEFGAKVEHEVIVTIEEKLIDDSTDDEKNLQPRPPVVVVMGHVDHGKTSLLDAIRHAHVTEGEAGGITQHIGAYQVQLDDRLITFLDTPGHAAFTSMRARGAQVTDVAILVVAADDGVMPQTVEAINHAKAAGVPIIVAVNKIDKEGANPDRVLQQLTEYELVPEEWGGDTIVCNISAKQKIGIENLLEMVLLTADIQELKANPDRRAKGTVIEAKLDRGRGPVATILIQNGTLHTGDIVIAGKTVGRVRAMTDDRGRKLDSAAPSMPVEIIGLSEVPDAGDLFYAVEDERMARELAEQRKNEEKDEKAKMQEKVTLENLFSHIKEGEVKDFNIIVKADVQGSAEAVTASLRKLSNEEVRVQVIHSGVGGINESDVMLAAASGAIIVGFNVRPEPAAADSASRQDVEIRTYRIIYDCLEEIESAMKGMLAPKFQEVVIGHAEVRQTFKVSGVGTIAGCYVTDGKVQRAAQVRIVRDNIVIHEGVLSTLRRFKDDAREVASGYECGMSFEKYNDIKEGDVIEAFVMEEIKR